MDTTNLVKSLISIEQNETWFDILLRSIGDATDDFLKSKILRFLNLVPKVEDKALLLSYFKEYFPTDVPPVIQLNDNAYTEKWLNELQKEMDAVANRFAVTDITQMAAIQSKFPVAIDLIGSKYTRTEQIENHKKRFRFVLSDSSQKEIHISIKPTSLCPQITPINTEKSVNSLVQALLPLYQEIIAAQGSLTIDMEAYEHKNIILQAYKTLRSHPDLRHYPHLRIMIQAYLKDSLIDVENLLTWSKKNDLPIGINLVKGTYWQLEVIKARQYNHQIPVWTKTQETDDAYLAIAQKMLNHHNMCFSSFYSHNVHSFSSVKDLIDRFKPGDDSYEFKLSQGINSSYLDLLSAESDNIRIVVPYGLKSSVHSYLYSSLLLQRRHQDSLLRNLSKRDIFNNREITERYQQKGGFRSFPFIDYVNPQTHIEYKQALEKLRSRFPLNVPLYINNEEIFTSKKLASLNPANPKEVVAQIAQASQMEADRALESALKAQRAWSLRPGEERAQALFRVVEVIKRRRYELSSLLVLEVGKQWDQAYHDVNEGIDFIDYYAREMIRLSQDKRIGNQPGEHNYLMYQGKGVALAIPPWNFPFAIAIGMCGAAIVTGNAVVFKPSELASAIGYEIAKCFKEAQLPAGVLNYCPGDREDIGDYLVEDPRVSLISFTGSVKTGLHIQEKAAVVQKGQKQCKRVIAEMGGKNAVILDRDIDIASSVGFVLNSAFAFQGQKCSACSRLIVHEAIYDELISELLERVKKIKIGPAEDPNFSMGAVISNKQQKKIYDYIEIAKQEGSILYQSDVPSEGYFTPIAIFEGIKAMDRIAQEEVFGPLLAIIKVKNFEEALDVANSTVFGLTGALISMCPRNIERARREFNVGNLYINQGSTGALVNRQPFGGFYMSGIGSKTGGPDYLLQFMDPKTITMNQIHSNFSPLLSDDDWV